ncbi:MAG: acyl-CoA dehydrogenase family protein, partial [Propionibacteriaceae bacterium]
MNHYKSNLRDIRFNLYELLGRDEILGQGPFEDMDRETADAVLDEVEHLASTKLAASFAESDLNPPVFDPAQHSVHIPDAVAKSYHAYMDSGFEALGLPAEMGGQPAPLSLQWSVNEMILGANPATYMYASGPKFSSVLWNNGTEDQKRMAQIMFERQWGATMVLTEPDAGSDVGAGRTRAIPQPDGSWHLQGVKRFITSAEHDMSENIIHLVLARPQGVPGAGGPGTKGLSLFVVPKYHFDHQTGELTGARNGVFVTGVEHKMGLKASTTCELTFGDTEVPAQGWLL